MMCLVYSGSFFFPTSFCATIHIHSIYALLLSYFRHSVDNLDEVVAIAIKAEFHTSCLESRGDKELNDVEEARLDELFVASRSLVEPVELDHEV